MSEDLIVFNGVGINTGGYLFPSTPLADFAAGLRGGDVPAGRHVTQLRQHHANDEAHLGVMYGVDMDDLASAGWALVTPAEPDQAVLEALQPLRTLRRQQAGDLYQELVVRPGEDIDDFLTRYGMAPGPADPRKLPYYLLLVADPEIVSF